MQAQSAVITADAPGIDSDAIDFGVFPLTAALDLLNL